MINNLTYLFVYLSVCGFTAAQTIVILTKLTSDIASETEIKYFKGIVYAFLLYIATEAVYAVGSFGFMPFSDLAAGIVDTVGMAAAAAACFCWVLYAEDVLGSKLMSRTPVRIAALAPIAILVMISAVSIHTGLIFDISSGTIVHGPLYLLPCVIDDLYLVFVAAHALTASFHEKDPAVRKSYVRLALFVIPPTICGILDSIFADTPILILGIFTSIYFIFVSTQESRIYNDALTQLNNRRSADRHLSMMRAEVSKEKPYYVFLMDVDGFKQINDKYGHLEGDYALECVAKALMSVANEYKGVFPARWGGDEFLFIVWEDSILSPEAFMQSVHQAMWELSKEMDAPYQLTISIGYAKCTSPAVPAERLIKDADAMLYAEKEELRAHIEAKRQGLL